MIDVCSVVKRRQIADQPNAPDWPPAHKLDQPIIHFRTRGDHHGATCKFTVAESQEQTWPPINFLFLINPQGKRPAPKAGQTNENRCLISEFSPPAETSSPKRSHIGRETDAQQVDVVNRAFFVTKPQNIARLRLPFQQGIESVIHTLIAKVA